MLTNIITSTFLIKLSKHLALLVCLLIVGQMSHRYEVSQAAILGLAIASALLHLTGRALHHRTALNTLLRSGRR